MAINFGDHRDGIEIDAQSRLDATDSMAYSIHGMLCEFFEAAEACGADSLILRIAAVQSLLCAAAMFATEKHAEDGVTNIPLTHFTQMAAGLWHGSTDEKSEQEMH